MMMINCLKSEKNGLNQDYKKTKFIRCVNCGRFCENGNINNIERIAKQAKNDGFEIIVFCCDASLNNLRESIISKKILSVLDVIKVGIRDKKGNINLIKS